MVVKKLTIDLMKSYPTQVMMRAKTDRDYYTVRFKVDEISGNFNLEYELELCDDTEDYLNSNKEIEEDKGDDSSPSDVEGCDSMLNNDMLDSNAPVQEELVAEKLSHMVDDNSSHTKAMLTEHSDVIANSLNDENERETSIHYTARTLNDTEKNYYTYEREALRCLYVLKKLQNWFLSQNFVV